ncbi:hypothetical protein MBLNU13_g07330t2 [Cladosporium sp. NU13]
MTASIAKLKVQLGLNIPGKISKKVPDVIIRLLEGFTKINESHADLSPPQIRTSEHIRNEAGELFEELGPDLWPDLDKQAGLPSWLSCSSGDDNEQKRTRRYYSDSTDRNFLADRFYELVCLKVRQYRTNVQCGQRKTNHPPDAEDFSEGEEPKSFGHKLQNNVLALQNVAEDMHNNFAYHPIPGSSNAPSEDIIPLSIGQESTQPIAAAPAPYLNSYNSMGATPTKLIEAELEFPNIKLKEHMKQRERTNRTDSYQLDANSAGIETLPFQARMENPSVYRASQSPPTLLGQNERSFTPTTRNIKRPLPGDPRSRRVKRSKNGSDVQTTKPTLIVVLKLTRGKGAANRPTTMPPEPPQQPHVPISFIEVDEIFVRHPSVPPGRHDAVASDAEIRDERTSIQHLVLDQDSMNDISEVAMDGPHNLNNLASAPDATDSIRPSTTTPGQPHATQSRCESQAMAEFNELWSGEAFGLVSEILTTSPSKHTPGELVCDILLPVLRHTRDQLSSRTVPSDPISASNDAQDQFTPHAPILDQQQSASVE